MEFCPRCGVGEKFTSPLSSPRGFQKMPVGTWLYRCYECGVKVKIQPLEITPIEDLRY